MRVGCFDVEVFGEDDPPGGFAECSGSPAGGVEEVSEPMLGSFPDVDPIGGLVPEDIPFGTGRQTPQLASLSAGPVVLGFDFEERS